MNSDKSFQSEGQLLGSMFLDPACIPQVLQIVRDSGYFQTLEHQTLFDLLIELHNEGIRPDLVILRNRLQERDMLAAVGGVDYLVNMVNSVATATNAALHAQYVRNYYHERSLCGLGHSIQKIMEEPGTVVEKINIISGDFAELQKEIKAHPTDDENALKRLLDETIAGRRQNLTTCWPMMDSQTRCFMPGTLTLLCGNPGASKSFMLLQLLSHFIEHAIPSAVLELEESRAFHTLRALAQRSNAAGLTDPEWIATHPEAARKAYSENEMFIRKVTRAITAPDSQQTLRQIGEWIVQKARAGARFISVDPITAAQTTRRDVWTEHNDFLQQVKQTAVEYDCSILLVTHPVKSMTLPDIHQLAGSAAFGRFCQSALWLEHIDEMTADIRTQVGTIPAEYNRVLHILKARNSIGHGVRLACTFDRDTLRLKEIGMVVKNKNPAA